MIISICFISASHDITTPSGGNSYTVNKDVDYIYNIRVTNNDIGINSGITQVNISLPSSFTFIPGSNNTNALYESFSEANNVLSWSNFASYLVDGNDWKYFEYSASCPDLGDYTLSIVTLNSTGEYLSTLFIKIADICIPSWDCTPWSECANYNQTRVCTDSNDCGDDSKPNEVRTCTTPTTNCTPDWSCTVWSECMDNTQIRSCVDANLCGDDSNRPSENQACTGVCQPIWDCSEWQPKECLKEETQTRTCTNTNNCEYGSRPDETRICTRDSLLFFTISVIIIITLTVLVSIIIIEKWWRNRPKRPLINKNPLINRRPLSISL